MFFGAIPDMLSQLIRSSFVASPGKKLYVSDFASIEARLIAWLAGEQWRLDVFNSHGKIYEASASQMFHLPIEDIEDPSPERDKGKIAELALGYQGGVNALLKMGALAMGIDESELQPIVSAWRAANPKIVKLWYDVDRAAKHCIRTGEKVVMQKGLNFEYRNSYLFINLPSGRYLAYPEATLAPGKYGDEIRYMGLNQTSKKWCQIKSYGGKLVENIIQALGRDCLAHALMNLYEAGYHTVFHVHDETVNEEEEGFGSMDEVNELMIKPAPWMVGLPLAAKGYEGYYYKKG
jgi:DNA polymerase